MERPTVHQILEPFVDPETGVLTHEARIGLQNLIDLLYKRIDELESRIRQDGNDPG